MKVLIAEDDPVTHKILEETLIKCGYKVVVTCDGSEAWQALQCENAPELAILDWMMPGLDGIELCQKIRNTPSIQSLYIILLTTKGQKGDIVKGLRAGADDYVIKPFDREELRARVHAGVRIVELQASLADRIKELEEALLNVKQLQEFLPICSYCKKIRDDQNYWRQVEEYVTQHTGTKFSHSICPACYEKFVKPELEKLKGSSELRVGTKIA